MSASQKMHRLLLKSSKHANLMLLQQKCASVERTPLPALAKPARPRVTTKIHPNGPLASVAICLKPLTVNANAPTETTVDTVKNAPKLVISKGCVNVFRAKTLVALKKFHRQINVRCRVTVTPRWAQILSYLMNA